MVTRSNTDEAIGTHDTINVLLLASNSLVQYRLMLGSHPQRPTRNNGGPPDGAAGVRHVSLSRADCLTVQPLWTCPPQLPPPGLTSSSCQIAPQSSGDYSKCHLTPQIGVLDLTSASNSREGQTGRRAARQGPQSRRAVAGRGATLPGAKRASHERPFGSPSLARTHAADGPEFEAQKGLGFLLEWNWGLWWA